MKRGLCRKGGGEGREMVEMGEKIDMKKGWMGGALNKKASSFDEALKEYGSYLLSRIVVQYHRP